jgi:predicted enzyme related to lactoylglutathione lyase
MSLAHATTRLPDRAGFGDVGLEEVRDGASGAVTPDPSSGVMGAMTTTTGGTTMLEKVFYTSVLVTDQDKALDFYTNVLGLEKRVENPTPDGPRFLTVGVKGDDFQLVLWPGTPGRAEPAMGRPPASITIETDDCRKTVQELRSRGVEFVSDVLEFPWGYVAQFQDPDGNRLQVREGR